MGRKQGYQPKQKQFKRGNINKNNDKFKRSRDNFKPKNKNNQRQGQQNGRSFSQERGHKNRQNRTQSRNNKFNKRGNGKQVVQNNKIRPKNYKQNQKTKKNNSSQYGHLVGKSLFQIVPEGVDADFKDKFAALNGQEQEHQQQQNYEQQQLNGQVQQQYQAGEDIQDGQQDQQAQQDAQQQNQEEYPGEQAEDEFEGNAGQEQQGEDQDQYQLEQQQDQQQGQENIEQQIEQQNGENVQGKVDIQEQDDKNVDISVISLKIQQTLQVLMNLPKLGDGKPRKYFVDKLKAYVHRYYGYNYQLIDHFLNFLNPAEMIQFFEANETQRPLTIRTNTLKTRRKQLAQSLIQRGVNLDPLAQWSKVGIKIYETKVPIGATPQYLAGYYMLQSASSFLPVLALDPQMNQKILDMASAPGGKTSYISQLMKNTGAVFANDLKKDRLKALQFNMFRLGITNTVVTCRDGRKYPEIFPNTFDRVLLDAPCTGLGIISKDHSIKANRVLMDIYKNSHVQKQLLLAAIDCTKVGGVIVYSTCSVSPLQNQQVINYALKKRHVKIVDIDDLVEVGDPGLIKFIEKRYHVDLKKTKRIYPHVHNMDGFYLGKLVKVANGKKQTGKQQDNQN